MSWAWKYGPYIITALTAGSPVIVHTHIHLWAQCSVFSPETKGGALPPACLISSAFWSSTTHQWRAGPQVPNITRNECWNYEVNKKSLIYHMHLVCLFTCLGVLSPSDFQRFFHQLLPYDIWSNPPHRAHQIKAAELTNILLLRFFY